jgi:hypothetical protein
MKKILTFLAITEAFALLPFTSASAHDHCRDGRLVGYTPCGKPVFAYHEIVGHDRCGRNVWEWVTEYPSDCHCRHHVVLDHCEHHHEHVAYAHPGWGFSLHF